LCFKKQNKKQYQTLRNTNTNAQMKSFIKNTNSNKRSLASPSSWSKLIIFTFTSFLLLHLISNSHITKACASSILGSQQNSQQEQYEQPIIDTKISNGDIQSNNNIIKDPDGVNNPKASPNENIINGMFWLFISEN
jgi:hypothetical protein